MISEQLLDIKSYSQNFYCELNIVINEFEENALYVIIKMVTVNKKPCKINTLQGFLWSGAEVNRTFLKKI